VAGRDESVMVTPARFADSLAKRLFRLLVLVRNFSELIDRRGPASCRSRGLYILMPMIVTLARLWRPENALR
jgi:hypothetical protein